MKTCELYGCPLIISSGRMRIAYLCILQVFELRLGPRSRDILPRGELCEENWTQFKNQFYNYSNLIYEIALQLGILEIIVIYGSRRHTQKFQPRTSGISKDKKNMKRSQKDRENIVFIECNPVAVTIIHAGRQGHLLGSGQW